MIGVVFGTLLSAVVLAPFGGDQLRTGLCTTVVDRHGRWMGLVGQHGCVEEVPSAELPPGLIAALIAVEDRRFREHPGVDVRAVASSVLSRRTRGASTLTMQLSRLVGLSTRERTLARKVREALLALRLERSLSKDEILSQYLSRAPQGRGIDGVAAASRVYFGKRPASLTLGEAAMLIALLPSPSRLDPRSNLEGACLRRRVVLRQLGMTAGWKAEAEGAAASPRWHDDLPLDPNLPLLDWTSMISHEFGHGLADIYGLPSKPTALIFENAIRATQGSPPRTSHQWPTAPFWGPAR